MRGMLRTFDLHSAIRAHESVRARVRALDRRMAHDADKLNGSMHQLVERAGRVLAVMAVLHRAALERLDRNAGQALASLACEQRGAGGGRLPASALAHHVGDLGPAKDRKSTRLNSSHHSI